MAKKILFSLENCPKCIQTKELLSDRNKNDIEIITFPHDINRWSDEDFDLAKTHDVLEDLQRTAPILWVDGEKIIGYLRIKKWLQE
ncbi:hypothetical protein B6U70_02495 [Euryarchaeota archaeon ex4484_162]|nr:MAG: hypothetical protein B6U70_02495 [Euryarchaeota archaeon ex4484_162]RLF27827.1 MAG: hypothetical protein DRN05_05095 [Thermoplasmata archaeon]RLF34884.1 MAG: hypothetical protein DRN08_03945 [Thermoplasmata archaeon]